MGSEALAVTGLFFGDEGKGATVDLLTMTDRRTMVVKSSGGAQCAHNVLADNRHHTFAQIGSGAFNHAVTYLSEYFVFNPINLWRELRDMDTPYSPMFAHPMMPVVTEYHRAANRAREDARGEGRHGSTGQGIGELQADLLEDPHAVIRACMLPVASIVKDRLRYWRDRKRQVIQGLGQPVPDFFDDDDLLGQYVADFVECPVDVTNDDYLADWRARSDCRVVFEGGQGVLLDEHVGFHPHTTWGRTTPSNAMAIAERMGFKSVESIGVMRAYTTRHGAGPLPTEDPLLHYAELHNTTGKYQGAFRQGHLDLMLLDYAIMMSGVSSLALNHLDLVFPSQYNGRPAKVCVDYQEMDRIPAIDPADFQTREALTRELFTVTPIYETCRSWGQLRDLIEERTRVPVRYIGFGPDRESKRQSYYPTNTLLPVG